MHVCIIGDASEPLDEGMKKTTAKLAEALGLYCDVLVLNPLESHTWQFWQKLIQFRPAILHYVPGPSLKSFVLLALCRLATPAATVMSLTHPDPNLPLWVARRLKPQVLLVQSRRLAQRFQSVGSAMHFIPNGVDLSRYRAVSVAEKQLLRRRLGVPAESFVALHVGNTRKVRNLDALKQLQQAGVHVIVVSSTTIRGDSDVGRALQAAGCTVWNHYIERIEEVYAVADCYVFPTPTGVGAIELPLSVLEAMACNLPVVTRKFGALPVFFESGNGFYFVESDDEMVQTVLAIRQAYPHVDTAARVAKFDWRTLARQIVDIYQALLDKQASHSANHSVAQRESRRDDARA